MFGCFFDLTGSVACVTGASSGLGRRAADVLVRAGAKVVGVARRAEALEDWQSGVGADGAVVSADLSDQKDPLDQPLAVRSKVSSGKYLAKRTSAARA